MDAGMFALLTGGVKFDRKKFGKDMQAFNKQDKPGVTAAPVAKPAPAPPAPAASQPPAQRSRKRAKTEPQPAVEDIDLFSASRAAAAAAPAFVESTVHVSTRDPNEEANVLRKTYRIKVSGGDVPVPLKSFTQLQDKAAAPCGIVASRHLMENLAGNQWLEPTPIQRQAIPTLLGRRELLAIAPTGSGKTLAFLLPIVMALRAAMLKGDDWPDAVKAVVLSPTHELAAQQARVLKALLPGSKLRACLLSKATAAGTDFSKVDILLANPLRLASMVEEKKIDLGQVRYLVLDEADKLFELGFMEQIDGVLSAANHPDITRALFSATLPEKVEDLARSVLQQPLRVTVGERNTAVASVRQRLLFVGRENGKLLALRQLLGGGLKPPVLVFVSSKERAKVLHRELMYDGCHVDSISADQSPAARDAAVANFRLGRTWVLIATDLIGRGMDFVGVNTVVNYDFPNSTADYIHRIGRTGRAGQTGDAVTLYTEDDSGQVRSIANLIKAAGGEIPEWMLHLKKEKRRRKPVTEVTDGVSTQPKYDQVKQRRKRDAIQASRKNKKARRDSDSPQ